jgi:hypothetical protein
MSSTMIFSLVVAAVALFMVYKIGQSSVPTPAPVVLGIDRAIGIHQGLMKPIETIVEANGDGIDEKTKAFVQTVASAVAALSIRNTADSFDIPDLIAPEGKQRIENHTLAITAAKDLHETIRSKKEAEMEKLRNEVKDHAKITQKTVDNSQAVITEARAAMTFFQV